MPFDAPTLIAYAGPVFRRPIAFTEGETVERNTPNQPISAEAALISDAMSLIADRRHWCKGRMRKNGPDGPQYCMHGAIRQASGRWFWWMRTTERNAVRALNKECKKHGFGTISQLNDCTTHGVVLRVARSALAKERAKALV